MDNSIPIAELLVRYLDGDLRAPEKTELEQRLRKDKELQTELENLQIAREAVRQYGLRQTVGRIHKEMMEPPVRKMSNFRRVVRYSVAVAASLILIAGCIVAYNFYSLSSDKVFRSNYLAYELNTVRGDNTEQGIIEKTYREKNYKGVTVLAREISNLSPTDRFLIATSWMEIGQNAKAIDEYVKLLADDERTGSDLMHDETEYYLLLAYVHNKDYDQALDMMYKIRDNKNHLYYKKITPKFIRQIKMLKWR